jgi:hypothetical protein
MQMAGAVGITSDDTSYILANIQKIRNVAYLSALVTLLRPKINGIQVDSFFMKKEMIIVSTEHELFVINVLTPSFDLRVKSDEATAVNNWLDDLRIVARN